MSYNEKLANRIRERFADLPIIEEKEMMGGLCFMLKDKMVVGVFKNELMCRLDPAIYEEALEKTGCREMNFTGRPMKGWVLIEDSGMKTVADLNYWVGLAVDYNERAKSSKKKK